MKKPRLSLLLAVTTTVLSLSALPAAHAGTIPNMPPYTWTFSLPADAPYTNCTITFHANGYALTSEKTVARGGSISWSSPKPLSMIFGYCNGAYYLNGQYCDGQDVKSGSDYTKHACTKDVRVKFCPKTANPSPYYSAQYGFCPD